MREESRGRRRKRRRIGGGRLVRLILRMDDATGSGNAKTFPCVGPCMRGATEKGRTPHRVNQARKKRRKFSFLWSQAVRPALHPWCQTQYSVQATKQLKHKSNGPNQTSDMSRFYIITSSGRSNSSEKYFPITRPIV
jgi:hypothetical protein